MANNPAYGPFRRHFVMEGITNGSSIGNVSIGGATRWGEAYIMCTNVVVENTIKYTRTPVDTQGRTGRRSGEPFVFRTGHTTLIFAQRW